MVGGGLVCIPVSRSKHTFPFDCGKLLSRNGGGILCATEPILRRVIIVCSFRSSPRNLVFNRADLRVIYPQKLEFVSLPRFQLLEFGEEELLRGCINAYRFRRFSKVVLELLELLFESQLWRLRSRERTGPRFRLGIAPMGEIGSLGLFLFVVERGRRLRFS